MNKNKRKILILVEGLKTDVRLMNHLLNIYSLELEYQIVSYKTNIYVLYNEMFLEGDPSSMDILQVLKEREQDPDRKKIFDEKYSDILLIFDFEPQDPHFSDKKIIEMTEYFVESSDMGKLYINYPMVESFYHMKNIPDDCYNNYFATLLELKKKTYKKRVNMENRNRDYSKFANIRKECNIVIVQNINKAWHMLNYINYIENTLPDLSEILKVQLDKLRKEQQIFVLCTSVFFIADYNPKLLIE